MFFNRKGAKDAKVIFLFFSVPRLNSIGQRVNSEQGIVNRQIDPNWRFGLHVMRFGLDGGSFENIENCSCLNS